MMDRNCQQAMERVYFYLDGEINWFRRMRIRRHLRRCDNCNGAFEFEASFLSVIRRKGIEDPPQELMDRLRAFLREHVDEAGV